jgi:hypothetical protein
MAPLKWQNFVFGLVPESIISPYFSWGLIEVLQIGPSSGGLIFGRGLVFGGPHIWGGGGYGGRSCIGPLHPGRYHLVLQPLLWDGEWGGCWPGQHRAIPGGECPQVTGGAFQGPSHLCPSPSHNFRFPSGQCAHGLPFSRMPLPRGGGSRVALGLLALSPFPVPAQDYESKRVIQEQEFRLKVREQRRAERAAEGDEEDEEEDEAQAPAPWPHQGGGGGGQLCDRPIGLGGALCRERHKAWWLQGTLVPLGHAGRMYSRWPALPPCGHGVQWSPSHCNHCRRNKAYAPPVIP